MNTKPVLFSAPMVNAILEGRKTQTRRVVKEPCQQWLNNANGNHKVLDGNVFNYSFDQKLGACPYGKPGDLLWVRETWSTSTIYDKQKPSEMDPDYLGTIRYWADGYRSGRLRPSIFMPRWASRITLKVINVRVERLQNISEEDAEKEGCYTNDQYVDMAGDDGVWPCEACQGWQVHGALGPNMGWMEVDCLDCNTPQKRFMQLWQSINGEYSWNQNPWVWVVEFKTIKANIDDVLEEKAAA